MSYHAVMSNVRDPKNRSKRKKCVCGGHNHKNVKKNKKHHGTKMKLERRQARRFKKTIEDYFLDLKEEPFDYDYIKKENTEIEIQKKLLEQFEKDIISILENKEYDIE